MYGLLPILVALWAIWAMNGVIKTHMQAIAVTAAGGRWMNEESNQALVVSN